MSSRTSSALAVALVAAACSPPGGQPNDPHAAATTPTPDATPDAAAYRVECARGGGPIERQCTVDREADGVLTIRFPDGGFRKLRVTSDGRGVTAADGAEPARVVVLDGVGGAGTGAKVDIDIAVGADRIRLPAHLAHGEGGTRR